MLRGPYKRNEYRNLYTDTVGSIVAGFPDLAEQRAIAAFLDRETGRVDRLVAKKRELIERLKEKRRLPPAPKGRNNTAQGNALGSRAPNISKP